MVIFKLGFGRYKGQFLIDQNENLLNNNLLDELIEGNNIHFNILTYLVFEKTYLIIDIIIFLSN